MTNKIEFTESAKKEIQRVISTQVKGLYFRIRVQGGGCSGFKYTFNFDDKINPNDTLFEKAIIDNSSLKIIDGSIVDLGCGYSRTRLFFAKNTYKFLGFDYNSKIISYLKRKNIKKSFFFNKNLRSQKSIKFLRIFLLS